MGGMDLRVFVCVYVYVMNIRLCFDDEDHGLECAGSLPWNLGCPHLTPHHTTHGACGPGTSKKGVQFCIVWSAVVFPIPGLQAAKEFQNFRVC